MITATVTDQFNNFVANGTSIDFSALLGTKATRLTTNGSATIHFRRSEGRHRHAPSTAAVAASPPVASRPICHFGEDGQHVDRRAGVLTHTIVLKIRG
jgi:hypothetical protein